MDDRLRRILAVIGLIGLAPTAFLAATGQLSAADAGVRAVATLVAVALASRLATTLVRSGTRAARLQPREVTDQAAPTA